MNYDQKLQLEQLKKQKNIAHYMLLATVIATVVNVALLLSNGGFHIPYSAALPYYLTLLGFFFDGYRLGTYTATGMVMAFVCLAVWLLVWWMARGRRSWLLAGMVLVIVDTVALAAYAFSFLTDPSACLLEALVHIAVIYEISRGLTAYKQEARLLEQIAAEEAAARETPPESQIEYTDIL